jgi:transcriptional regulator with XRE-family HTH domain|tara:strand:+ start:1627 stop:2301 length:675 start_codon:yes stop_codon:yes gene_type:complete
LYQRLHKVRSDKGISQTDLSNETGVSQSVISKIERGALKSPGYEKLEALAAYLDCSVADFIDDPKRPADATAQVISQPQKVTMVADLPLLGLITDKVFDNRFTNSPIQLSQLMLTEVMTKRPPFLEGLNQSYAVRQLGDEMSPRYRQNEILYVAPEVEPVAGDDVMLLVDASDENQRYGFVRELVSCENGHFLVRQHNPAKEQKISKHEIAEMHLVIGSRRRLD